MTTQTLTTQTLTTQTSDMGESFYNSNQTKPCLFVQGFDTNYQGNYEGLINHLNKTKTDQTKTDQTKTDIIKYDNNVDIQTVINQIISKLGSSKYDLIIGHSMGGFLLAKTLSLFLLCKNSTDSTDPTNPTDISDSDLYSDLTNTETDTMTNIEYNLTKTKIILLQPLLEANFLAKIVSKYISESLHPYIYLPRLFINPSSGLVDNKTIFNDLFELRSYVFINTRIISSAHLHMLLIADVAELFNSNKNLYLMYSEKDTICPLSKKLLDSIDSKQTYSIDSKHEPFNINNPANIIEHFYNMLDDIIQLTNQLIINKPIDN
jgi:hypothetical protein